MCKYSCLDCKNYRPSETKVVGRKLECNGMISVPVYGDVPHHCVLHPRYFKKWWKENSMKTRDNITEPKCLDLHEHLKTLGEMIKLSEEILSNLKDEKEG